MPTILIKEIDETSAVGSTITDIAYVPGLLGTNGNDNNINKPILCSTESDFESYFGSSPATIATEDVTLTLSGSNMVTLEAGAIDKSYVYAKELIRAGVPVYYEAFQPENLNKVKVKMGACQHTGSKARTAPTMDVISTDTTVKDNANNTLDLIGAAGTKDLYIDLDNENKVYYVTINIANSSIIASVQHIYPKTGSGLGNALALENMTSFTTSADTEGYMIHIHFEASDEVTLNNFITVMVSEDSYKQFSAYSESASAQYIYEQLSTSLDALRDKSLYDIKYITSGGYPTFSENNRVIADKMMAIAADRGDCIALIDHVNESARPLVGSGSLYDTSIKTQTFSNGAYGAMFTPYAEYTCNSLPSADAIQVMPASFGYLMCLAKAVQTSPNWLAMAGVTRGVVPNIKELACINSLSNVVAEAYQPRSEGTAINAITNVRPYGLTIWGNRTLARAGQELKATNFLNTRNMISDIKKQAYLTARECMFEQDTDTLWLKFKSGVSPLLDSLKSGYGISNYKLIKSNKGINGEPLGKGQIGVVIKIYPIYAVEYFEISVVISDDVQVS